MKQALPRGWSAVKRLFGAGKRSVCSLARSAWGNGFVKSSILTYTALLALLYVAQHRLVFIGSFMTPKYAGKAEMTAPPMWKEPLGLTHEAKFSWEANLPKNVYITHTHRMGVSRLTVPTSSDHQRHLADWWEMFSPFRDDTKDSQDQAGQDAERAGNDAKNSKDFRVAVGVPRSSLKWTRPQTRFGLFFGGNGETMDSLVWRAHYLSNSYGMPIFAAEMPGYGDTEGPMGVPHSYDVALSSLEFAVREMNRHVADFHERGQDSRPKSYEVVLFAASIGTFNALKLAAVIDGFQTHRGLSAVSPAPEIAHYPLLHADPGFWGQTELYLAHPRLFRTLQQLRRKLRVVLQAPPGRLVDVAANAYRIFPVRYLMSNSLHYDVSVDCDILRQCHRARHSSETKRDLDTQGAKVLIIHGDEDEIVPMGNGVRVYDLLGSNQGAGDKENPGSSEKLARFVKARGYHHNNIPLGKRDAFGRQISDFLSQ